MEGHSRHIRYIFRGWYEQGPTNNISHHVIVFLYCISTQSVLFWYFRETRVQNIYKNKEVDRKMSVDEHEQWALAILFVEKFK